MKQKLFYFIVLCLFANLAIAHGMSAEDKAKALSAGPLEFIELGAIHMITGYDHLLFLFGVMFFLTRFRDIVKFVTAFTIGHSITLIIATFAGIKANYYLIDAVIALTVCYKGFDNLDGFKKYVNIKAPNILWMVFIFGLIHGFGLSTRLQQLPLNQDNLLFNIISFNIGVELGQIAALAIMVLVLTKLRKFASFENWSRVLNAGLIFVGGLLLLMQLHGYQHTANPEEYPLNKDDHYHIHEDMKQSTLPLNETILPILSGDETLIPSEEAMGKDEDKVQETQQEPKLHTHDGKNYHTH